LPYKLTAYKEVLILFLLTSVIDQEHWVGNKIFFAGRLFILY
jgi:hypothetical protein